jgi:hypothetical protein
VSGALSIANTKLPGNIKIAIVRTDPFSGSGPIATITFAMQNAGGGMTSVTAKLIDSKGGSIPVQAAIEADAAGIATAGSGLISTPGVPFSQPEAARASSAATTTPSAASSGSIGLGTVSMSGDNQPKGETRPVEPKTAPATVDGDAKEAVYQQVAQTSANNPAEPIEPAEVKQVSTVYIGVLNRFRTYQGARTPEALVELFAKPVSPFIRQDPEIVISDGKAKVQVTIDLSAIKGTSTNFALIGAKLVSLKRGTGPDTWVLESLPQANILKASVIIMNSSSVIEFPMTVVPPVAAVSKKQADFAAYLKDSTTNSPKRDLNGDGRYDYLDDFIYAAHYKLNSGTAAKTDR